MGIYQRGQSVRLAVAFTDAAGVAADPTTVTCKVERPDGTETTYTEPTVTNPSAGAFELIVVANQSGTWRWRWEGVTGPVTPVAEGEFHVMASAF